MPGARQALQSAVLGASWASVPSCLLICMCFLCVQPVSVAKNNTTSGHKQQLVMNERELQRGWKLVEGGEEVPTRVGEMLAERNQQQCCNTLFPISLFIFFTFRSFKTNQEVLLNLKTFTFKVASFYMAGLYNCMAGRNSTCKAWRGSEVENFKLGILSTILIGYYYIPLCLSLAVINREDLPEKRGTRATSPG